MHGDRSVLLCVVCFISGLVIRCVVSVTWYCESENFTHLGLLWRLGAVKLKLFQTAINPQPPYTTWKDQSCFSLQPGHYSSLTAPNLQPTANQGM